MIIRLTEEQYTFLSNAKDLINEDVFVNDIGRKRNRNVANLTYSKNSGYNKGNKNSADMLKTNLMDNGNGNQTYEVPLKGGLISYNITNINGTEVMHYFKRIFDHEETKIKINGEEYNLEMENDEFRNFMEMFLNKVNAVVEYRVNEFKQTDKEIVFDNICIYPVPSSSNFNKAMADRIVRYKHNICGMPTQTIDANILMKNTKNLQKDDDFIKSNQQYYNDRRFQNGPDKSTHMQNIDNALNKFAKYGNINNEIIKANQIVERLITKYYSVSDSIRKNKVTDKAIMMLADLFEQYQNQVKKIREASEWFDVISQQTHIQQLKSIAKAIKYTKGPSVEKRTGEIYHLLRKYGYLNNVTRQQITDVCRWEPVKFQIKKLGNDIRMALKNYFQPNNNKELVDNELSKTVNSVVVVFDDNVSGGATLSDICLQLRNLGIKYIIPITFGKMRTSYTQGVLKINEPENGFNF